MADMHNYYVLLPYKQVCALRCHNLVTTSFVPFTASQQLDKANKIYRAYRDANKLPAMGFRSLTIPHREQRYILDANHFRWENPDLNDMK